MLFPGHPKVFYERENDEKYVISLPFDKFKIQLPSAISRGQNVYNLLSKLTLHVSDIDNFEDLPIPFFCIATNVETGEQVLLDSGSLPQAIAASGAFPSLFQPVKIEDQILIDGGVVNNYPIDELRAKGMDIIIGADVQDSLVGRQELKSAPDILLQINNYRTINDMKVKSGKTDVYIKPDIKDFTVVSFNEGARIIENGRLGAIEKAEELKAIAKKQNPENYKKTAINNQETIKINKVSLSGNETYTRAYVMGKLKFRPGETITHEQFNKGINNLIATNNFDSFLYDFELEGDGYNLNAVLTESEATTFLKLGVHYDDLYKSAALVNLTKKKLLVKNDVASLDVILGDNIRYNFDYYIDKGFYWSIGLRSKYTKFHKNINASLLLEDTQIQQSGLNKIDVELNDFTNQFYLQTLLRRDFSFTVGAEHKHLKIASETIIDNTSIDEETVFEKSDFFSVFGKLKFDTYNNKYFPKKGFLFDGDFQLFVSSSDFNNNFSEFSFAKANIGYAIPFSNKFSVLIGSEGGFKIGDDSNNSLNFALGGYGNDFINNFVSFYGYDFITITGNSFVKGYVDMDYEWIKKHHIRLGANFSNTGEDIFENGEWITTPDYSGYAVGYAVETFLGPLEGRLTWSPETKKSIWFFNLGFWF